MPPGGAAWWTLPTAGVWSGTRHCHKVVLPPGTGLPPLVGWDIKVLEAGEDIQDQFITERLAEVISWQECGEETCPPTFLRNPVQARSSL